MRNLTIAGIFLLVLSACLGKDGSGSDPNFEVADACGEAFVQENDTGAGCRIRLVSPANCEEIDLSNGKTYNFEWTTDGSTCETPWKIYLAVPPANAQTGENVYTFSYSVDVPGGITRTSGIVPVSAETFQGLDPKGGYFHWTVAGYYGAFPQSRAFRIKR